MRFWEDREGAVQAADHRLDEPAKLFLGMVASPAEPASVSPGPAIITPNLILPAGQAARRRRTGAAIPSTRGCAIEQTVRPGHGLFWRVSAEAWIPGVVILHIDANRLFQPLLHHR